MADDQLYVVFKLGAVDYGAPISMVQEIIEHRPATRLPGTPPFVEGVIDLRGQRVIPVVNLRMRLGLPTAEPGVETRIMVVECGTVTGLVVDGVTEVLNIQASQVDPPDRAAGNVSTGYLLGVARLEGRLVPLIDLARVIGSEAAA